MRRRRYEDCNFERISFRGEEYLFYDMRIDSDTVPEGKFIYEVADDSSNGDPARIRNGIMVDFFGTIISDKEMSFDDPESCTTWIQEGDWSYLR